MRPMRPYPGPSMLTALTSCSALPHPALVGHQASDPVLVLTSAGTMGYYRESRSWLGRSQIPTSPLVPSPTLPLLVRGSNHPRVSMGRAVCALSRWPGVWACAFLPEAGTQPWGFPRVGRTTSPPAFMASGCISPSSSWCSPGTPSSCVVAAGWSSITPRVKPTRRLRTEPCLEIGSLRMFQAHPGLGPNVWGP